MTTCPVCGARSRDGLMCSACWNALARDLRAIPGLIADLDLAASKQARLAPPTPGGLASERNPVGWGAADAAAALTNSLTTWARDVATGGHFQGDAHPAQLAAMTLVVHREAIRAHPAAAELADDISAAVHRARTVIDKPTPVRTVGACPTMVGGDECSGDLRLDPDDGTVHCARCKRQYSYAELRVLGEQLAQRPIDVYRAEWFTGVPASTIRRWISEKRCPAHKHNGRLMVTVTHVEHLRDGGRTAGPAELTTHRVSS